MSQSTHAIVESLEHYEHASALLTGETVRWYSTSPLVVETLRARGAWIDWLDKLQIPGTADRVGYASLRITDAVISRIAPLAIELAWPRLKIVIGMQLHRLLSQLLFKQAVLRQWAQSTDGRRLVVGEVDLKFDPRTAMGIGPYDTVYAALAAISQRPAAEILGVPKADVSGLSADIDRQSILARFVSLSELSISQLAFRAWRLFSYRSWPRTRRDAPTVYILNQNNETIREMLPHLIGRGCRVELLRPPMPTNPGPRPARLPDWSALNDLICDATKAEGLDGEWEPVATIVAERLRASSPYWPAAMETAQAYADRVFHGSEPKVIVSSSVRGYAASALAAVARQRGIPTIVVQHGVSAGLSCYHEPFRHISEALSGDRYFVCAPAAETFFAADARANGVAVTTIGLPRQARTVPHRRWQRMLIRASLRCGLRDRLVMYLAGTVQNNKRFLPHSFEDHEVHALQRAMADRVMPRVRGVPVIKLYPTRRYRDGDPMGRDFAAPKPVRTLKFGDFRFLRAGADILILESPLSTLGWVMGTQKPVFYLAHPSLPLLRPARAAMEESLFFIDLSRAGWEDALVAGLNRPDTEIEAEWAAKAHARARFLDEFVFGPRHAGRTGAHATIAAASKVLPA